MRHFVSVRRLCDFGRARKTLYRFVVSKKKKTVGARREQEREQDRGRGFIHVAKNNLKKKNFARGAKVLRLSRKCSKANSDKLSKSYDLITCLYCLVLWKLRNLETRG